MLLNNYPDCAGELRPGKDCKILAETFNGIPDDVVLALSRIIARIDSVHDRLACIESDLSNLQEDIDAMQKQIGIRGSIEEINKRLDVLEDSGWHEMPEDGTLVSDEVLNRAMEAMKRIGERRARRTT